MLERIMKCNSDIKVLMTSKQSIGAIRHANEHVFFLPEKLTHEEAARLFYEQAKSSGGV